MAKKSVYAAVEISDRDVRLVVLEVFDTRHNILRVEKVSHNGVRHSEIVDQKAVTDAVEQAVSQAQTALGYRIERVLLVIPSKNVKTRTEKASVSIEDGTHTVRVFHIQQGLKQAMSKPSAEGLERVNVNRIVYETNGASSVKLPVGQDCTKLDMQVSFLEADKATVYAYVSAVEKAGLQVLDICLEVYAQAKETAVFDQSNDKAVILVTLEADHTVLTLVQNGEIKTSLTFEKGYESFTEELGKEHNLSQAVLWRLLQNLFYSREMDAQGNVIYIEQQEDRRVEISERELAAAILPKIRSWIAEVNSACSPILAQMQARYVITGAGGDIPVLKKMEPAFNAAASVYTVTDIGARSAAFTAPLGIAYAWTDQNAIWHDDRTSVNNNELEASIESITRYGKGQEGGFTKKLKKVMLTNHD
jgi:cell division protein FtsA